MFTQPTRIPRSPLASALTLLFHVCLMVVVAAMSAIPRGLPQIADRQSLVYVTTALPPVLTFEVPLPAPSPEPAPPIEIPKPAPAPPEAMEALVIERPPAKPADPIAERPRPRLEPSPLPPRPPPEPVPPPVVVGAFADTLPASVAGSRAPAVVDAGFTTEGSASTRARRTVESVTGFEAGVPGPAPVPTGRVAESGFAADPTHSTARRGTIVVESTGFAAADSAARRVPAAPPVTSTGFAAAPAAATPARVPGTTASAGFAEAPAAREAPPAAASRPNRTPVEILHKPAPAYTSEARARRIEGEVSIEVEFTAAGQVRILRIVRGLGYGLDAMARRAAEQIRFTPATRDGVPVDFRTTLTIVFRLT